MDFFALPDLFLRKVLQYVNITDRLTLRLTCRAFEKLVADSDAGYFDEGSLYPTNDSEREKMFEMQIGDLEFRDSFPTKKKIEKLLSLRNRLFSGIKFRIFSLALDDSTISSDFIREFVSNFTIEHLNFSADTRYQLDLFLKIISCFPNSKYHLETGGFLPDPDILHSLAPLECLEMWRYRQHDPMPGLNGERWKMPVDVFLKLLDKHKNIFVENVELHSDDFVKALKIISADNRERTVEIWKDSETVRSWLNMYGITEGSKPGEIRGEFEIAEIRKKLIGNMRLRYKNCNVDLVNFDWSDDRTVNIMISKEAL